MNDKTLSIIIKAKDDASAVMQRVGEETRDASNMASEALGRYAKAGSLAAGAAIVTGLGLATKASWDQVSAVQQATVALHAYETNGTKVSEVLKSLVAYARSDMGVLFNRKDLFAAAQSLKTMGDNTDQLTEHVKIMSRSVGLGLSTWDELSLIVGRVGSTGRLAGDDFDNLTKAGYKLDPALRNTNITFDSLFQALSKGIPANALAGQANTINGANIRLQTAFRDVGNAILGVDRNTNQFVAGGLGARLVTAISNATTMLREMAPVVSTVTTAFIDATTWVARHQIVLAAISGVILAIVVPAFYTWALAAGAAAIATLTAMAPVILIGAAVGALAYLIISNWNMISATTSAIFTAVFNFIGGKIAWLRDNWASAIGSIIGFMATLPIMLPIYMFQAISAIIGYVMSVNWGGVFGGIVRAMQGVAGAVWDAVRWAFDRVMSLNWGGIMVGVGRGIANTIIDMINGALKGAFSGVPLLKSHVPQLPHFANGVRDFEGGLALVGEKGPEIVSLPHGANVYSNKESVAMSGNATFNMYGNINLGSADAVDSFFARLNAQKEMGALGVGV